MNGDHPEGGAWNFDKKNRKPIAKKISIPKPILASSTKKLEM